SAGAPCARDRARPARAWTSPPADRRSKAAPLRGGKPFGFGTFELGDDRVALGDESARRRAMRRRQQGKAQTTAKSPRAREVTIREETGQRQRQREQPGGESTRGAEDEPDLYRVEHRHGDDRGEQPNGRIVRLFAC